MAPRKVSSSLAFIFLVRVAEHMTGVVHKQAFCLLLYNHRCLVSDSFAPPQSHVLQPYQWHCRVWIYWSVWHSFCTVLRLCVWLRLCALTFAVSVSCFKQFLTIKWDIPADPFIEAHSELWDGDFIISWPLTAVEAQHSTVLLLLSCQLFLG